VKNAPTERVKIKKQDFAKRSNQRRKDVHPTVASISTYSLLLKKIVPKPVPKPVLWVVEKVAQRPVKAVTPNPVKAVAQRLVKAIAERAVERPVPNPLMMCVAYV
jgi:hypothetical protein